MKNRTGVIILRIVATIIVVLFILILSLHLYLKKNSPEIFRSYIDKLLKSRGSIYKIDHNSIDIDLLGGQIVLKNLKISFDEEKLKQSGLKRAMFLKASIPFLSITGISVSDLVIFRKITAERILLLRGKLKFYLLKQTGTKKKEISRRGRLPAINFGGITIEDTDIEFFTDISKTPISGLKGINLDTGRIELNPKRKNGKNFIKRVPALLLNIDNSFIFFKKNGYKANTDLIRFGSAGSSISIKNFKYAPASREILKKRMALTGKYHLIEIPEINLKNIDINELIRSSRFKADQLYFKNPDIYFFRNKNIKRKKKKNGKKLPQQILRETGLKVDFDLIRIKNGDIKYTEIAVGEKRGESLIFGELKTSLYNISNFPEILKTGIESEISVSVRLMSKSLLKAKMMIPINNRAGRFSFSGSLSKTDPSVFNKFLKRNVKIKIDKGKLNYMTFSVQADKDRASGSIKLAYNDLHLTLMKKKRSAGKSRFGTFLANSLTHKNNPKKRGRKLRTGKIQFKRVEKRSMFDYMWKCILDGIKSSIKI
ncbi:MAG: hypothetical protein ABFR36_08350 [Acidobacteriota bacterium]